MLKPGGYFGGGGGGGEGRGVWKCFQSGRIRKEDPPGRKVYLMKFCKFYPLPFSHFGVSLS